MSYTSYFTNERYGLCVIILKAAWQTLTLTLSLLRAQYDKKGRIRNSQRINTIMEQRHSTKALQTLSYKVGIIGIAVNLIILDHEDKLNP